MRLKPLFLGLLKLTLVSVAAHENVGLDSRVDCGPEPGISKNVCQKRGCVWAPTLKPNDQNVPWCHYPPDTGYFVLKKTRFGSTWQKLPGSVKNPYGNDIQTLNFKQTQIGAGIRIVIGTKNSFVPDIPVQRWPDIQSSEKLSVTIKNTTMASFTVERTDGTRIWDTSIGCLIFGKQYIQIATFIPTDKIYGFGEQIHQTLMHDLSKYKTWPMFARDQPPNSASETRQNLYGVHNFYLALEKNGKAHGVFLLNSNAQEVVTGPGPHLTYRAIGGRFEIFFLPGPTPNEVIKQYQQIVGRPYLPAYWALGFQFCRYGYKSLDDLKDTISRIENAQIPMDGVFADIDYMERFKDFTTGQKKWRGFSDYADQLHQKGMKLTLIFDPAIEVTYDSFSRGLSRNASFIIWPRADLVPHDIQDLYPMAKNTQIMLGVVWPDKHVAFPDFYDDTSKTTYWWVDEFKIFHNKLAFDGIWIDMNEPSVFGTNRHYFRYYNDFSFPKNKSLKCPTEGSNSYFDNPPYKTWASYLTGKDLCDLTLCMFAQANHGKQTFYDVKSLYGLKETIATSEALKASTGKRGQIISRSTFATSGHFGGHWLGDNTARWEDLRTAIIGVQEFNLFSIPHVGSDVCGFIGSTNEELCLRWHQLGAFHSFFRNHNDIGEPPQDPSQWPSVAQTARIANHFRYRHLPYLYTLHFTASIDGGTVIRPIFFEFPNDSQTFNLSYQFMWGPAIIVIPVTSEGVISVNGYLPEDAEWYYLYSNLYGSQPSSGFGQFYAPKNSSAPAFLRGGFIVPRQVPAMTTKDSRKNNFQLAIACNQKVFPVNSATGDLYWDDGESWIDVGSNFSTVDYYHFTYEFTYSSLRAMLNINLVRKPKKRLILPTLEQIEIFGYTHVPIIHSVKVNGKNATLNLRESSYSTVDKLFRMSDTKKGFVQLDEHLDKWTVTWKNMS